MKLEDVVNHFLMDAKVKSRTAYTLTSYRQRLGTLLDLLGGLCDVVELEQVRILHLRRCVQHIMSSGVWTGRGRKPETGDSFAVSTVRTYVRVWKVFFNWCYQEELMADNPVERLSLPRPEKRVVPTFTAEHVQKMLATCDTSTESGFRDYVILLVLLDTGMRLAEIHGLRVSDVHDSYVKVFGKGRKEREIGLHPEVSKLLWKYIHKYRHPTNADENALFIGRGKRLSRSGLDALLRRVREASGLGDIKFSAHVFRHTFAKMYLEQGGEIFKLSREMGHSDVQVTKLYLEDFNSAEARKEHTTYSPIVALQLGKKTRRKQGRKS